MRSSARTHALRSDVRSGGKPAWPSMIATSGVPGMGMGMTSGQTWNLSSSTRRRRWPSMGGGCKENNRRPSCGEPARPLWIGSVSTIQRTGAPTTPELNTSTTSSHSTTMRSVSCYFVTHLLDLTILTPYCLFAIHVSLVYRLI